MAVTHTPVVSEPDHVASAVAHRERHALARALARIHVDRRVVVPIAIVLVVSIGIGDLLTQVEETFTLLYLLPISLAAWHRSRNFALLVAVIAAALSGLELVEENPRPQLWDEVASYGIFVTVAYLVGGLRAHVDREEHARRAAIEQLRHSERLNVIGTLAAGVAHELGTPLTVIGGSAEILESEDLAATRVRALAATIRSQTAKISDVIRHLLDFARRGGTSRCAVDLRDVASSALDLFQITARKQGCRLELVQAAEPVQVEANRSELEQVLSNLVLNAIQAMPRGGTAQISTAIETRLDTAGAPRRFGALRVNDDGVGIRTEDLERIFDPFFTTKGIGEGTGLGLSVSYGIVHDHDGTIEVRSTLGRGTTFTVLLPLRA